MGWRGYLAPKLASLSVNHVAASALVAVVWTAWHVPYLRDLLWIYNSENLMTFIPRYLLLLFVLSIVYGEVRNITGTFWPAVLMHAVSNAFGHPLAAEYVTIAPGKEYLASVSTGMIMIGLFGLLGIALYRRFPRSSR
jgi:membrane protease YdiL (CAAX protease family)